ncbi:MAG: DUF2334 domain-containing protein [Acidobacteriota bacterium]
MFGLVRRVVVRGGSAHRPWLALVAGIALLASGPLVAADAVPIKRVLVLYEPGPTEVASGLGDARQLQQLLGHFHTAVTLEPVSRYRSGEMTGFDLTFWVGFTAPYTPPPSFLHDVVGDERTFVWLNTGLDKLARQADLPGRFGFEWQRWDTTSGYDSVEANGSAFTKTDPSATVLRVTDPQRCTVLATARSSRTKAAIPYVLRSGSFWVVADSPFSYATESDRYLLFADLLHDMVGEQHSPSHSAIIRIEDTNPFSDPASLRDIADILSSRHIPFLVGVIPFYVNPADGTRVAMSDKPDYVDALRYMVDHGGTVVMHGITHQYKGETATDYEFWDESRGQTIQEDSSEYVERKIRDGLVEFFRNGIYPLIWETPHYSASELDYAVFARHFSSAIEQRLVLNRLDFSQYFPYLIDHDLYGQRIYPEDLGYVPLDPDPKKGEASVDTLLGFARDDLAVRDGYASAFFHPFVDHALLIRLVDGIRSLGYTFRDLRDDAHTVTLADRAIVTGAAHVTVTLRDQFLRETTYNEKNQVVRREVSDRRLAGPVTRSVSLPPGWIFVIEPTEYRERALSLTDRVRLRVEGLWRSLVPESRPHTPISAMALTVADATGGAANDQASLPAPLVALNVPVSTVTVTPDTELLLAAQNLVLVPYNVAENLSDAQVASLVGYVKQGGHLVTDFRNPLAVALGVRFLDSTIPIEHARDRLYPEEVLRWPSREVMSKFETTDADEILAMDDATEMPVAFCRRYGGGAFIFFGTRFDPTSDGGFSRFPYLAQEIGHCFGLTPMLRRDELEMYFDPGYRHTVSIEQLVARWTTLGIKVIHAGAWHEYPKYTYDYARLIREAHANGILVYAWLEPPQVSQKFWNEHPGCREKNFKGQDVQAGWRYPVALADEGCLTAATESYEKLLRAHDWDGVDIGELHFEPGFKDPLHMTPLDPAARAQFKSSAGFDPVELFNPTSPHFWSHDPVGAAAFTHYRVATVTRLHEALLAMAARVQNDRPGFQVVVTLLDSLSAPALRADLGIDGRAVAGVAARFGATLQVEDPESMWSEDPRRYQAIASRWSFVPQDRLALDLNILAFRAQDAIVPFPTRIQTGTEAAWLVHSAALGAPRVTIYSESSINQQDLALLPYALAARAQVKADHGGWTVSSPDGVVLELTTGTNEVRIDGRHAHSIGGSRFLLPAGIHSVDLVPASLDALTPEILETRLGSITGELTFQRSAQRSVQFGYRSQARCIATFARQPYALLVDGREVPCHPLKGDGRFSLMLPAGTHTALVVTESSVSYGVDITSYWSSFLIAAFGVISSSLLVLLYLTVRIRRRARA